MYKVQFWVDGGLADSLSVQDEEIAREAYEEWVKEIRDDRDKHGTDRSTSRVSLVRIETLESAGF